MFLEIFVFSRRRTAPKDCPAKRDGACLFDG